MDFTLTPEQRALQEMVLDFGARVLAPKAAELDEREEFCRDHFTALAELGLTGLLTPEAHGGAGASRLDTAIVVEALARHDLGSTAWFGVHLMVQTLIHKYGDEATRQRWLPPLARGERLASFCLTEPDAGSDAASLKSTARRDGDHYVLDGNKVFITTGGEADVYVVFARTGGPGAGGISAFLVEKGTPGFVFGKKERKMGLGSSPTVELSFKDCRIHSANRLGDEGIGFKIAMSALDGGRISVGAGAVGLAQAALDHAVRYAAERVQFGKPIAAFQGIQFMLADMATDIEASRLLVYQAASLMDRGEPFTAKAAMAKRFATDTAMKVTADAVQIFGGYGYMKDYPVERLMRAAKVLQIVEGTNQIQRIVIARSLLPETRAEDRQAARV